MRSVIDSIKQFDYNLFSFINGKWHNSALDVFFLLIREAAIWVPFYVFLLLFVTINFKKRGWWWVLSAAITVIISNYVSSNLIKGNFVRLRPCHDPLLFDKMRILAGYCPVSSSFTSSHATNHFAISMFLLLTFKNIAPKLRYGMILWAALISYAQVYVGVHFPTDVLAGAIAGIIIGYLAARIYNQKIGLIPIGSL